MRKNYVGATFNLFLLPRVEMGFTCLACGEREIWAAESEIHLVCTDCWENLRGGPLDELVRDAKAASIRKFLIGDGCYGNQSKQDYIKNMTRVLRSGKNTTG